MTYSSLPKFQSSLAMGKIVATCDDFLKLLHSHVLELSTSYSEDKVKLAQLIIRDATDEGKKKRLVHGAPYVVIERH